MVDPTDSENSSFPLWKNAGALTRIAIFLVIMTTSWYLLKELAVLLRPLLLAVLVCYLVVPTRKHFPTGPAATKMILLLVGIALGLVILLGFLIYGSALEFNEQLPHLTQRAREITSKAKQFLDTHAPELRSVTGDLMKVETQGESKLVEIGGQALAIAANVILEAVIVGLYVIFLLVEGHRLQRRVEKGFFDGTGTRDLEVVRRINAGLPNICEQR